MKTIYNRLDKEYIKDLPLVSFPGKIITVNSEREADKAVPFLLSKDILGVDTETRPSFKKGQQLHRNGHTGNFVAEQHRRSNGRIVLA